MSPTPANTFQTRPLSQVSADDVRLFIADGPPESDTLEFKERLSVERGASDRWFTHGDRIGDQARDALMAEVVAFANAHGGTLILGVEESETHPKRAKSIKALPRCADLANRLRLVTRDTIEPQLPVLELEGVATESDGAGVVLIRVPQSRLAPHRVRTSLECFVRRADRTERMTMREIQDLVLFRSSSASDLVASFDARRARFRETFDGMVGGIIAIRVTAIPTAPLYVNRVYRNDAVKPNLDLVRAVIGKDHAAILLPITVTRERPVLRGAHTMAEGERLGVTVEVLSSGEVEVLFRESVMDPSDEALLPEWAMSVVCHALFTADRFRIAAGVPAQEYAFEMELMRLRGTLRLADWGNRRMVLGSGTVNPQPVVYPRMSFGERAELPTVIGLVFRDLMNSAGFDYDERLFVPELPPVAKSS